MTLLKMIWKRHVLQENVEIPDNTAKWLF